MFPDLEADVEKLEIPVSGEALAAILAIEDRLAAKVSEAIAAFDAAELYDLDGATSTAAWLRRQGLSNKRAVTRARAARTLRSLPLTKGAWDSGQLSSGQVDAILANVPGWATGLFAEHEAELIPTLLPLTTQQTAVAMQAWLRYAEATRNQDEPAAPRRTFHHSATFEGKYESSGSFDAEGGTIIATAIKLAENTDAEDSRGAPERRGDALVDVCRWFLDHRGAAPKARNRPHVNVVIDYPSLLDGGSGELVGNGLLDAASIRRLLCDAGVHRIVTDGRSTILDYGRQMRTVSDGLFNALVLRDRGCRFVPECDRPPEWCDAHHVVHWADGGETSLFNTVLACSRHHHQAHAQGWALKLEPDGTLHVTMPDGRIWETRPPGVLRC